MVLAGTKSRDDDGNKARAKAGSIGRSRRDGSGPHPGGGVRGIYGTRLRGDLDAGNRDPRAGLQARALCAVRQQAGDADRLHRRAGEAAEDACRTAAATRPRNAGACAVIVRRAAVARGVGSHCGRSVPPGDIGSGARSRGGAHAQRYRDRDQPRRVARVDAPRLRGKAARWRAGRARRSFRRAVVGQPDARSVCSTPQRGRPRARSWRAPKQQPRRFCAPIRRLRTSADRNPRPSWRTARSSRSR